MAVTPGAPHAGFGPPTWIAGRYELGEVVGRGGMGEVRAATDVRLHRKVAVKLLRVDLAENEEVLRRFEGEARAAAALVHPNVVAVFDAGEEDGSPFIVMELLPGRTLADELARGPLSTPEVYDLAASILGALEAAHRAGIVHRDVKPGNVLRAADGSWKVADFGIAKVAEAAGDLTLTGTTIGTPAYLAPERIRGEPATPAADLYATGVVLYEALTGRKAFVADNTTAFAERVRAGSAPAPRELVPDVEPTLELVIERAMATDPRRRFAHAADMRRALGEGTDRVQYDTTRFDDKTEPQPAPTVTSTRAQSTSPQPERRARRARRWWLALPAAAAVAALVAVGIFVWQRDTGSSSSPSPPAANTPAQPGVPLPPDLDRALDQLREAVQP